ncbi:MAG: glycosyl hydrolase family 28-related protein, partial [Bacteroidales bacterium]
LVIADDAPSDATEMWKTEMCSFIIAPSISAVLPASHYTVPAVIVPTTFPAENVILGDSSSSLIARNVEDALQELGTSPYYSVKLSGCVGDGVTDDTDAFQNAIDSAIEFGKILYIDVGTYLITDRLHVDSSLTIIGGNHDTSLIKFQGEYHEETDYDEDWWVESNACLLIKANNCRLENFTIIGGTSKYAASESNGIIFHYPNALGTSYSSAERCQITQVDVKYFTNGMYVYAGWNRYITCCQFVDNAENGIKWYPLELETVGSWSASGDVLIACQFIGNIISGIHATSLFEFTAWNSVFEYNGRAMILTNCNDVTFKNCWNEANDDVIKVTGCAKFEGGYNIQPSTVEHTVSGAGDIVVFEAKANTIIYSGSTIKFNQEGGIITKGVELSVEVDNMISNSEFWESSGGTSYIPSMLGWSVYGSSEATDETLYGEAYTCHFTASGLTEDVAYGFRQVVSVEVGKTYDVSFMVMTEDRSTIDSTGVTCYISYRNAAEEITWSDNRTFSMIADDVWEEKTLTIEPAGDTVSIYIGFGCIRNGDVYFAAPSMSDSEAISSNNVFIRTVDATTLEIINMSGVRLGTIAITPDE